MGLLDDAIREHLELKRRHGADPGEVAQEERAALTPVFEEDADAPDGHDEGHVAFADTDSHPASGVGLHEGPYEAEHGDGELPTGQETAELDMQAVLEGDIHEGHQGDPLAEEALRAGPVPVGDELDSIDWSSPGEVSEDEGPAEIPGQERLSFE